MTKNILADRERALEYEFFHRVDQKLLQQLKDELQFAEKEKALSDATNITDESVLEELVKLDINSETLFALSLFPLVWVAWADGTIEDKERQAILEAAHCSGHERDTASHQLVESWLDHEPSDQLLHAWKDYVHHCCKTLTPETRESLKRDVVSRARRVAEAAGGILGFHKISHAEAELLDEVEKTFDSV